MKFRSIVAFTFVLAVGTAFVGYAVDGIAVSANFTSGSSGLTTNGGWGPVNAYIIEASKVKETKVLYSGLAKEAVINQTGEFVAFRKKASGGKGTIAIADINSGTITDLYSGTNCADEGRLAWPKGDWVYFQLGWPEYDSQNNNGGEIIWKVNVKTKEASEWFTFTRGPWYWAFDTTFTKMIFRNMDDNSAPWGQNIKMELQNGLPPTNNTETLYGDSWAEFGSLGAYGCGTGLSPSGKYTMSFTSGSHNGWNLWNWSDNSKVKTFGVNTFDNWGGQGLGGSNFGNKWSANSDAWISIRQSDKQVLLNWQAQERIVVTQSGKSETGDFWVGTPSTGIAFGGLGKGKAQVGLSIFGTTLRITNPRGKIFLPEQTRNGDMGTGVTGVWKEGKFRADNISGIGTFQYVVWGVKLVFP